MSLRKWRELQEKKHLLKVILDDLLVPLSGGDGEKPSKVIEVRDEGGMNFSVSRRTIINYMAGVRAEMQAIDEQIKSLEETDG